MFIILKLIFDLRLYVCFILVFIKIKFVIKRKF